MLKRIAMVFGIVFLLVGIVGLISPGGMSMSAGAAIILGGVAIARGELTFETDAHTWTAIMSLALISTALAFLVFVKGLSVLGPVRTAIVSTVEPFFTALLGAWVLRQPMTRATLIGGAMIAAAVILLQLRSAENGSAT